MGADRAVIVKIVTLMLVVLAGLAIFGRMRLGLPGRKAPPRLAATCRDCGRPRIGKGPCPCQSENRG